MNENTTEIHVQTIQLEQKYTNFGVLFIFQIFSECFSTCNKSFF